MLAKIKGKFVIIFQGEDDSPINYQTTFTIAEELAHYILHKDYFTSIQDIPSAIDFYSKLSRETEFNLEREAKQLAAAILVPLRDLKKEAVKVLKAHEKVLFDCCSDDDEIIERIADHLSDRYQVVSEVIKRRLRSNICKFQEQVKKMHTK